MRHFLLASFAVFLITPVYAITGLEVCNYGKEQVSSVVCNGPTIMKQTSVNGDINVTGSLQADMIFVKSVIVKGSTQLSDSQVSGSVNITGDLSADNVTFKQGIAVQSDNIILNRTKVNGLVTITSPDKIPYLQIQCGSEVTGSVLFDGKPGVVQITADDSVVRGKIINGSTMYVNKKCE
jgi:cytoskeletal protein CcmA (bactofilin family)